MPQINTMIILLLLIVFAFVPLSYLKANNVERQALKQNLNLSAKALLTSIEKAPYTTGELSKGHYKEALSSVDIRKEYLLDEFYHLLSENYRDVEKAEAVKSRILVKVLVHYDKFFVADQQDRWSAPYFFTYVDEGKLRYVNIKNNDEYYYGAHGICYEPMKISEKEKNTLIIDKINEVVAQYTHRSEKGKAAWIKIKDPADQDMEYRIKYSYFNVLDGLTFFVVYVQDTHLNVNRQEFEYKHYNVAGYTLEGE